MRLFETIFLWIGTNFTTHVYLFFTRIHGIMWSMADILLVFIFLKIAGLIRAETGRKKITWRYFFLWFSAALTPALIFTQSPMQFLLLESLICGIQFSILVYTIILERRGMMNMAKKIVKLQ